MQKKRSLKKILITAAVVVGALVLLVGSFFIRDIMLRAGIFEYERGEILSVKQKYSSILDGITSAARDCGDFVIKVERKGIFEKSDISYDENSLPIKQKCSEQVDVLCHGYCCGISKRDNVIYFDFNLSGTKRLAYGESPNIPEGEDVETLDGGWNYIFPSQKQEEE